MILLTSKSDEEQFPKLKRNDEDIQRCATGVKKEIDGLQQVQIAAFGAGNEEARSNYVLGILKRVMMFFDIKKFGINVEHLLGSEDTWGSIEYVLTPKNPKLGRYPVGFVLEVKKENFDQGRAFFFIFSIFFFCFTYTSHFSS
jgi:hypothetical protein